MTTTLHATVGGMPTLLWRGRPLPMPMFCLFYEQALRDSVVTSLAQQGVGSFAVRSMLGVGDSPDTDQTLQEVVQRVANVARLAPQAAIMPDLLLFPTDQWLLDHPHECFITADSQVLVMGARSQVEGLEQRRDYVKVPGPTLADAGGQLIQGEDPRLIYGRRRVSPFSQRFAQAAAHTLERLLDLLAQRGLTDHVWGMFLECYNCGEWNLGMSAPDQSRAAAAGYRAFLARCDGLDVSDLAQVSPPPQHEIDDRGGLRLPDRATDDYLAAEAHALADQFLHLARHVKQRLPRLAIGGFFPGVMRYQSACLDLYRDPAVDFIATPLSYDQRGVRGATVSQGLIPEAMTALGKVWWDELDTMLHTSTPDKYKHWGRPQNEQDSVELMWRDAGQMLVRGHAGWWLDFGNAYYHKVDLAGAPPYTWHHTPGVLDFHRRFADLWARLPELDRTSVAEVKVFTPSVIGRRLASYVDQTQQRQLEWSFAGVPLVYECLEHLLDGRVSPGKLNLIFGSQHLEAAERAALARLAKASPDWWLWWYGAGIAEPDGSVDPARTTELHGITQRWLDQATPPSAAVTAAGAALLQLPVGTSLGGYSPRHTIQPPAPASWRLVCDDSSAQTLATWADDAAQPAVALRRAGAATHVAWNLPLIHSAALRGLARAAGCHVYLEQDHVLHASRGLLLVHTAKADDLVVQLPGVRQVRDLRQPDQPAYSTRHLSMPVEAGRTLLYELRPS